MEIIRRDNDIDGEDIPKWVLVELLLRLPSPKIVCSFKLVSKQWLSIISDPLFVRTYVSQNSPRWTFISSLRHHQDFHSHFPYNFVFDDVYSQVIKPEGYTYFPLPYTPEEPDEYVIQGVSNGLVLYGLTGIHRWEIVIQCYYICNPVTRSWFALPKCSNQSLNDNVGFLTRVEDGVLINYTVVLPVLTVRTPNSISFEVFNSEIGEWKNYTAFHGLRSFGLSKHAAAVNGVLHWLHSSEGCIIAYDPYQSPQHVNIIKLPERTAPLVNNIMYDLLNRDPCLCGEYKGKLRYFTSYPTVEFGERFEVWVLNDDDIWSLQYAVSDLDIQYGTYIPLLRSDLVAVSFHPFDTDVVCMGSRDDIISFNFKKKRMQDHLRWYRPKGIGPHLRPNWNYASSLVIPSWPISLSRFSSAPAQVD